VTAEMVGGVLAGLRRVRQRRPRGVLSAARHRFRRRVTGVRPHGADSGLCDRTCVGVPPEPGRVHWAHGSRSLSSEGHRVLRRRSTRRISIPVTNTSVNLARSTAVALFVGGWALQQLWPFWIAPIPRAVAGGVLYSTLERR